MDPMRSWPEQRGLAEAIPIPRLEPRGRRNAHPRERSSARKLNEPFPHFSREAPAIGLREFAGIGATPTASRRAETAPRTTTRRL